MSDQAFMMQTGRWSSGLCSCFTDCSSCWCVLCCPSIVVGQLWGKLIQKGLCVWVTMALLLLGTILPVVGSLASFQGPITSPPEWHLPSLFADVEQPLAPRADCNDPLAVPIATEAECKDILKQHVRTYEYGVANASFPDLVGCVEVSPEFAADYYVWYSAEQRVPTKLAIGTDGPHAGSKRNVCKSAIALGASATIQAGSSALPGILVQIGLLFTCIFVCKLRQATRRKNQIAEGGCCGKYEDCCCARRRLERAPCPPATLAHGAAADAAMRATTHVLCLRSRRPLVLAVHTLPDRAPRRLHQRHDLRRGDPRRGRPRARAARRRAVDAPPRRGGAILCGRHRVEC